MSIKSSRVGTLSNCLERVKCLLCPQTQHKDSRTTLPESWRVWRTERGNSEYLFIVTLLKRSSALIIWGWNHEVPPPWASRAFLVYLCYTAMKSRAITSLQHFPRLPELLRRWLLHALCRQSHRFSKGHWVNHLGQCQPSFGDNDWLNVCHLIKTTPDRVTKAPTEKAPRDDPHPASQRKPDKSRVLFQTLPLASDSCYA